jgi:hypothetical protein
MGRKSSNVVNAEINRIRRVLESTDKPDTEIMEELQIKEKTFYRYKQRIHEQDKDAWLEIAKESLESAALKVKKSLDYCIKISKDVADNSQDQRARLEAAKKVVECTMMYYKMLKEGPTSKTIVLPKEVKEDSTNRRMESLGPDSITA